MNRLEDKELALLLKKSSQPKVSVKLSNSIMNQIQQMEDRKSLFQKYIRRSWIFISLACILSLKVVGSFSVIQALFAVWLNSILPGAYDVLSYLVITLIAGLLLFELNLLATHHFAKIQKAV